MSVTSAIPEVGQIVRVRQRLYLVEGLVAPPRPQDSTLVELSCVEDDAQGQSLEVLWERELDAAVLTGEEWARIAQRGFDPPEYFSAYLNTLRWNCVTSTDASLFQSPFRAGIRRSDLPSLEQQIRDVDIEKERRETMQDELEATRERQDALRDQIDRLRGMLNRSRLAVDFQEDHFRAAISCGLRIAGSVPLEAQAAGVHGPTQYTFPAIDERRGADPTWAATLDVLRKPRDRSERLLEWRRDAPIRPVVFEDPGIVTDEVVQLHLEHPVVRRLLSRFVSQGFVYHDLSRACLSQTNDAIPRVILLGRLALYGPGAARLHEEIIPVTARWHESNRTEPLTPYARTAETETLRLLDDALKAPRDHRLNETIRRQLLDAATRDIQDLLPHLETRAREYEEDARAALGKRADAEAKAMREILDLQQTHLIATISAHDRSLQLLLAFNEEERRQKEHDRRYWETRLGEVHQERETEPERIRALYEVKARRVEPIGLVYLWPVTN